MKKRVLFVLNACGGGATQGIREYLRFQQGEDIEAFLALPSAPNPEQREWMEQYASGIVVIQMPWWNIPNGMPFHYKYLLYFRNLFQGRFRSRGTKQLLEYIQKHRIDSVYTGSILIKEGALAAKRYGIPHYWHIKETFGKKGRVQFMHGDRSLQRFILDHSQKVICMTAYIKSFFTQFKEDTRLKVISDGIDPKDFYSDTTKRNALRKKLEVKDAELLIGMVASLSSTWKNHRVFIDAAARLKEDQSIRFVAFGPEPQRFDNQVYNTPHAYYQNLRKYADEKGLKNRMIWAGFHSDVPAIYEALDIFVHPCETEPFGRVIIESMAAGKAVVVPSEGGAREPVVDNRNGLIYEAGDAEDLSRKLKALTESDQKRSELGNQAREDIKSSSYTLAAYRQEMKELLL